MNDHKKKPSRKEVWRRREAFTRHVVHAVCGFAVVVLALLIIVPILNAHREQAAMHSVDTAVITLPPQQVDTLYISTPEPTPTPTPRPTPVVTAEPTPVPTLPIIPADQLPTFDYLPVVNTVDTAEKKVAITVDDCFQVGNLQKIIATAEKAGARLTIFPIGQNLSLDGMSATLKKAVELGFEIENHTWSHARVFRLPVEEMAQEIWRQDQALNQCLGVNYQEHFFRCMGGDGEMDQRTHSYLKQLGYQGIAHWSYSGSDAEPEAIAKQLKSGEVYLFHTTDRDTGILLKFIPWVVKQGYQLVTLNELVGLPENEITPLALTDMPEPEDYAPDYRTIHVNDYSWMVVQLQNKLRAMGYLEMEGASTGYYGKQTAAAVAAYQADRNLPATGDADSTTQQMILLE